MLSSASGHFRHPKKVPEKRTDEQDKEAWILGRRSRKRAENGRKPAGGRERSASFGSTPERRLILRNPVAAEAREGVSHDPRAQGRQRKGRLQSPHEDRGRLVTIGLGRRDVYRALSHFILTPNSHLALTVL